MKSFLFFLVVASFCGLLIVPHFVFAAVVISEIAWMGTDLSTADEWIELVNEGTTSIDLSGWRLEAADGMPSIALTSSISAGGFFLLERTDDGTIPGVTADLIYTGALSNSGETLVLKDASGAAAHTVDASSGWPAGDNATKDTMQRSGEGWLTAVATPRAANAGSTAPPPAPTPPPPAATESNTPPPVPAPPPAPSLGADAGTDALAIAGAIVQFSGLAFGLDGEPLDGARFFWNFGDGSTQEKKSPTHIFHFPGTYYANLLVQSGHYAGSDWRTVTVLPAEISISEVLPGEGGFIEILNASTVRVDIGGMFLTDERRFVFRIPSDTIIGPKGAVVLPAVNTHLVPTTYLDFRDARGVTLDTARFTGPLPGGVSWERDGNDFRPQAKPTPGKLAAQSMPARIPAPTPPVGPTPNPFPTPSSKAAPQPPGGSAPAVPQALSGGAAERQPASSEPFLSGGQAQRDGSGERATAIGAASLPSYAFLGASVLLGFLTAAGIVVLKRKLP